MLHQMNDDSQYIATKRQMR